MRCSFAPTCSDFRDFNTKELAIWRWRKSLTKRKSVLAKPENKEMRLALVNGCRHDESGIRGTEPGFGWPPPPSGLNEALRKA